MASSANGFLIDNYGDEEEKHFSYAMQLVTASSVPMVLLSAFRLGLFEIINNAGPEAQISATQIAGQLDSTNPDTAAMVDRMLCLLASHAVVTCSAVDVDSSGRVFTRVYGLAPAGKFFVRNRELGGASLGPLLALIQTKVYNDSWYALEDAVLKGGVPFTMVHGTHAFGIAKKDTKFNDAFNQAMVSLTTITISRILDSYKGFQHLKNLVDVGGGLGITISSITAKYPTIEGINFDLPHVVQRAPPYSGVQHIGGDMFESVPSGDAILLKAILHDWDEDHCLKLLKNCYSSLPEIGKIIVIDALLPVNPDTSPAVKTCCQKDMLMLTQQPGGKERSEEEYLALANAAGFTGIKKVCFVCNVWVMEFYK